MLLTVPVTWNPMGIMLLNRLSGFAVMSVMVSAVHLGVVDATALPWCPPMATEEAVTWNTGQMGETKMVTPVIAVSLIWICTCIPGVDLTFGIVVNAEIVPSVLLGVVDPAVLPWCPPWSAEEAVSPNTGQMEAIETVP